MSYPEGVNRRVNYTLIKKTNRLTLEACSFLDLCNFIFLSGRSIQVCPHHCDTFFGILEKHLVPGVRDDSQFGIGEQFPNTGHSAYQGRLQKLIDLAERHDFVIVSDECYSEIYLDEAAPPPGLLQAAAAMGNDRYRRCLVFHSLSKRSNVPGLRSGFVAGDADLIEAFFRYRTYFYHPASEIAIEYFQAALFTELLPGSGNNTFI